ncbi:hypothetical protein ACSTHD_23450, partial [Vibrio parahaemolyticus]
FALAHDKDGKWKPIDKKGKYTVGINSYSFAGGEGFDFSSATDVKNCPEKMSDLFRSLLEHAPNQNPEPGNRIAAVDSGL